MISHRIKGYVAESAFMTKNVLGRHKLMKQQGSHVPDRIYSNKPIRLSHPHNLDESTFISLGTLGEIFHFYFIFFLYIKFL